MDLETFLAKAKKLENSVQVYEEATIFFGTRTSNKEVREILVRKRHTGNTILLVFHSLRSVPVNIYEICNYITVFKTNDAENRIEQKFDDERLMDVFRMVNYSKNKYEHITMKIN